VNVVEKDIWEVYAEGRTIVVPTNGSVNKRGEAFMGRGVAKQAAQRFPDLPYKLGRRIRTPSSLFGGNRVHLFADERIITFPVKRFWHEMADLDLIILSARKPRTSVRGGSAAFLNLADYMVHYYLIKSTCSLTMRYAVGSETPGAVKSRGRKDG
jgi:hypothetical protein